MIKEQVFFSRSEKETENNRMRYTKIIQVTSTKHFFVESFLCSSDPKQQQQKSISPIEVIFVVVLTRLFVSCFLLYAIPCRGAIQPNIIYVNFRAINVHIHSKRRSQLECTFSKRILCNKVCKYLIISKKTKLNQLQTKRIKFIYISP